MAAFPLSSLPTASLDQVAYCHEAMLINDKIVGQVATPTHFFVADM